MLNLVRNLNVMIGLLIPEGEEHWQLLLMLQEILEIVLSKKVTVETPQLLTIKIYDYLSLLSEKFPNSLKPKHHFLVHYPSVMRQVGPLWHINCMKFESKHREAKQISHSSICRVNVCRTIALKHQLILNYRFLSKDSTYPSYSCGRIKSCPVHTLPEAKNFMQLLPQNFTNNVSVVNSINYMGNKLKRDSVIVTSSELGPAFHFVYLIILVSDSDFLFITKCMDDCYLNEHLSTYKIYDTSCFHWVVLNKNDLDHSVVTHANKLSDGKYYICKKWM